jgi:predicted ATPase
MRFVHDRIREALLAQLEPAERRDVHRAAAELIDHRTGRDVGADPETAYALAAHCRLGGLDHHPERAYSACTTAGRRALPEHARVQALTLLEDAADAARHAGIAPDAAFMTTLGIAQHRAGHFLDAVSTLREAQQRAQTSYERAQILGHQSRVHDSMWNTTPSRPPPSGRP